MIDPKDHIPDHDLNEPDPMTEEDYEGFEDYEQAKEDLEQEGS